MVDPRKSAVQFDPVGLRLQEGHKIHLQLLFEGGGSTPQTFRVGEVTYDSTADVTRVDCLNEVLDEPKGVLEMSSAGFLQGRGDFTPAF